MENIKDIQIINLVYNQQPPNDFSIPYLFYTNKLVQKHNENLFSNTSKSHIYFQSNEHWSTHHVLHLTNF
jgi:hypothetical protein